MTFQPFFLLPLLLPLLVHSQSTNFIDPEAKLIDFAEKEWYIQNIPFLDLPDPEIEAVYYYRWSSLKRHLRYTLPGVGFIITEFVHKVGYSQKFDTINAAAGHHIDEAKWLRDPRYVQDYINVWAREGAGNQQYSEWIADAAYTAFLVNGDAEFIRSQQLAFVTNFFGWDDRFEPDLNLYFITPHDDAMEHSASSEQTDDPYHGGLGYRPSFNSEMYANALAIAKIARMNGDVATADDFEARARAIREGILRYLWDSERTFFYHVFREDNPSLDLLDSREEIGFFPWRFGVPPPEEEIYDLAWDHLWDPSGFNSAFGPTTCEQRSPWFDGNQTSQCCWWNGNSWPYSTGHTLRSLAAQVKRYRSTDSVNSVSFHALLHQYARTQYKNGKPYVAECHSPTGDFWVCDGRNHSEHYAHSTYNDNVLTDLIGIEGQADDSVIVNPLVPPNWDYFLAENVPYHGHNLTVLWDRDGSRYETGNRGLQIYVNGVLSSVRPDLGLTRVPIPSANLPQLGYKRIENYATNVDSSGYPMPSASFSAATDSSVWQAVDGRIFYDFIPSNRWSNYGNDIESEDWFALDFGPGRSKTVDQVKLYIYSDYVNNEGGVDCPTNVRVQYFDEDWVDAVNQVKNPSTCIPNSVWSIHFNPVKTEMVRVIFTNDVTKRTFVGISEIEVWGVWPQTPEPETEWIYEAEDGYMRNAEIASDASASSGSFVKDIGEFLEFSGVYADNEGVHTVEISYSKETSTEEALTLSVNNYLSLEVSFPAVPDGQTWSSTTIDNVTLWRGNNVLIFKKLESQGSVAIDKIKVFS